MYYMKLSIPLTIIISFTSNALIKETILSLNNKYIPLVQFDDDNINVQEVVTFYLYTITSKNSPKQLFVDDAKNLKSSYYNVSLPTILITHGWKSNFTSRCCGLIRQDTQNVNVIVVDWSSISTKKYQVAASRVRVIGHYIGKMVNFLISKGTSPRYITLIGHSFGAHMMGFAGRVVHPKVDQIVGLDVAGVGFRTNDTNLRLSEHDAEFVQVVHSNIGQAGITIFIGAADFYPNGGGPKQPGCSSIKCSHSRAYMYYAESIRRPNSWYGVLCNNYNDFNNRKCLNNKISPFQRRAGTSRFKRGKYMLRTDSKAPYGLGIAGTRPVK